MGGIVLSTECDQYKMIIKGFRLMSSKDDEINGQYRKLYYKLRISVLRTSYFHFRVGPGRQQFGEDK